jgi:thioredoxin reductase (NADPH)
MIDPDYSGSLAVGASADSTAYPTLTPDQLDRLSDFGDVHEVGAGEPLFLEGQRYYGLVVVLDGSAEIVYVDHPGGAETVVVTHGPGRFLGELSLLTGQRAVVHGRMASDGRVLRLDQDAFRRLLASDPEIADIVFAAFVARREILRGGVATGSIRVVGSRHSGCALDLVNYLRRQRVGHQWIDLDSDHGVAELLADLGVRPAQTPVVVSGHTVLRNPTIDELAAHLGLVYEPTDLELFDVVIVGAGPAGLAAAVYGASEGLRTLVVDSDFIGGQAGTSSRIENYAGFPSGISGGELVDRAALQAQRLGARISSPAMVTRVESAGQGYRLTLADGAALMARSVVLSMGVQYRRLPVPRLRELEGAGVYYAATDLEARVCGANAVTVVGGGNSAGQAAVFLAEKGADVTLVIRGADLSSSMSTYLIDRIDASPKIRLVTHSEVTELHGDTRLEDVTITNNQTGDSVRQACVGLFSFIGTSPSTSWLEGFVELDAKGFVLTDSDLGDVGFDPLPFETSRAGVFAAGDVRSQSMKRVAAAVGDGSSAIRSVHQRLAPTTP